MVQLGANRQTKELYDPAKKAVDPGRGGRLSPESVALPNRGGRLHVCKRMWAIQHVPDIVKLLHN